MLCYYTISSVNDIVDRSIDKHEQKQYLQTMEPQITTNFEIYLKSCMYFESANANMNKTYLVYILCDEFRNMAYKNVFSASV